MMVGMERFCVGRRIEAEMQCVCTWAWVVVWTKGLWMDTVVCETGCKFGWREAQMRGM